MIPIPQQIQEEHHSIPIMNSQQHQEAFNQPQSAHSERSEWLDVDEEFPPSKPKSASMLHSYSAHSQNSDQISSSEFSSQPFYNHPLQQQYQERMIESQHFHHPNPSSHRVPSVIRQFHPDQNENQDPTDGSERVGPEWNLNLVESSQQQQGPTFSYIDSGSKLAEQQPQLAPVRVSKGESSSKRGQSCYRSIQREGVIGGSFPREAKAEGFSYPWRIFRDPMQWNVPFADRPPLLFPLFAQPFSN